MTDKRRKVDNRLRRVLFDERLQCPIEIELIDVLHGADFVDSIEVGSAEWFTDMAKSFTRKGAVGKVF